MNDFERRNGELHCESVPLARIAREVGTPCYVYSRNALISAYREWDEAFSGIEHLICFSVKSNSNLAVLHLLAANGAGMDIVSGWELFRALRAGVPAERIVYSGVGKTAAEILFALEKGILAFNVESSAELFSLDRVAGGAGKVAPVNLRINPDVESRTHEYTSTGKKDTKFGIPYDQARQTYRQAAALQNLKVLGIDAHIGSQITGLEPFVKAFRRIAELVKVLHGDGFELQLCDIGGGLGINYKDENPPSAASFAELVLPILRDLGCRIILEPGRYISGNAGVLLTRVLYFKETPAKNFAIVDAAMNDLLRPSLYGAFHEIRTVREIARPQVTLDVVGPICESGDWLAKNRLLPKLEEGDLLSIFSAGAYGATMSSNYNSRPRGAEVLVEGSRFRVVRRAESLEDLVRGEEI